MTWERAQTYARNEGIAIGEQRGRQEKAIETAKTLLSMNVLTYRTNCTGNWTDC